MKRHINWTSYEEAIFSTFPVEFHLDDVFEILLIIPGTNLDDCQRVPVYLRHKCWNPLADFGNRAPKSKQ